MALSLSDLIKPETVDEALQTLLDLLELEGFPVTSWQPGSVPRTIVKAESTRYVYLLQLVAEIAKGGFVDLASGGWLTLLAQNVYSLTREPASFTRGNILLSDAGGGPFTIVAGQLKVAEPGGLIYSNITGGTLPLFGTLTLSWQAEAAGAKYNVPTNTAMTLRTPLPGVTASNPGGVGGTWITQQGADEESDASLRLRCKARWPELGNGATKDAYRKWALEASLEVTRVAVIENAQGSGTVRIFLAGPSGPVSSTAVTAVDAYIQVRRPLCVKVTTLSSTARVVNVSATIRVKASYAGALLGRANQVLTELAQSYEMGDPVYRSELIERLMGIQGVVDVVLSSPATDVFPLFGEAVSFTFSAVVISV